MKKEMIAISVLLLLFTIAAINAHVICGKAEELEAQISRAETQYFSGDSLGAEREISLALKSWQNFQPHSHIMLRHSETERALDGFFELLAAIGSEGGAQRSDFEHMRVILRGISNAEQLQLGTIF